MDDNLRTIILFKLQNRNRQQTVSFTALITAHNALLDQTESIKARNVQLAVEVERIRQENLDLQVKLESGGGTTGGKGGERTQALEQKVFKLQEEVTELHRRRGENAQQLIDANSTLQEKERQLSAKDSRIFELETQTAALQHANKNLEQSVIEASTTNQMLTDEQQALQLAFTSLEQKFRDVQEENNQLVKRWITHMASTADKLNEENDKVRQAKLAKDEQELRKAATENHPIDEGPIMERMLPFCVNVPSRAAHKFDAHEGEVNAIRWSGTGRMFATGGADRKLKLWEVSNGKCELQGSLAGSNAAIMSVEFDDKDELVLAASHDFASRVWTVGNQRLRHTLTGHSGRVLAAKFLGDNMKVVSGSHDRTLKIWDLRTLACIRTIFAGSSCNDLVTADGRGTNIISGHFDRKIRFWDTRSESAAKEIALQGRITSLDLSPDRTTLLSCSRDDTIKLIDLRQNLVSGTLSADGFHVGADWTRAVFSPDGEYVMAGSQDGSVYIWNISKAPKVEKVLKEHSDSSGEMVAPVNTHPSVVSLDPAHESDQHSQSNYTLQSFR